MTLPIEQRSNILLPTPPKLGRGHPTRYPDQRMKLVAYYTTESDREMLSELAEWLGANKSETIRQAVAELYGRMLEKK